MAVICRWDTLSVWKCKLQNIHHVHRTTFTKHLFATQPTCYDSVNLLIYNKKAYLIISYLNYIYIYITITYFKHIYTPTPSFSNFSIQSICATPNFKSWIRPWLRIQISQFRVSARRALTIPLWCATDGEGMPLLTGYGRDVDEHVITGLVDELLRTGDHNMSDLQHTQVTASRVECLAQIRIRLKK